MSSLVSAPAPLFLLGQALIVAFIRRARRARLASESCGEADARARGIPMEIDRRELPLAEPRAARWLRLCASTFVGADGSSRHRWEFVERTTTAGIMQPDGVECVALAHSKARAEPCLIVLLQYRAPVARRAVELPGGLIDAGETAEFAARRELLEETGYTAEEAGTAPGGGGGGNGGGGAPVLHTAPWLTPESTAIVQLRIDLDAAVNQRPVQRLEGPEAIEVLLVPLSELRGRLDGWLAEGLVVVQHVYTMARGAELLAS
eukprot:g1290.t1